MTLSISTITYYMLNVVLLYAIVQSDLQASVGWVHVANKISNTCRGEKVKEISCLYIIWYCKWGGSTTGNRFREIGVEMNTFAINISYLCSHVLLLVFSSPEQQCCLPSLMTNKKQVWLLMLTVPIKLHFHIPVCNGSLISLPKSCDSGKQGGWWVWATPETERMDLSVTFNLHTFTVLAIQMGSGRNHADKHEIRFTILKNTYMRMNHAVSIMENSLSCLYRNCTLFFDL